MSAVVALAACACVGQIRDTQRDASRDAAIDARLDGAIDARSDGAVDTVADVGRGDVAADRPAIATDVSSDGDSARPDGGCPSGTLRCQGRCLDVSSDILNCGECVRVCAVPRATARCTVGACAIATCEPGFGDCNARAEDGCESNLASSANCGRCGITCDSTRPFCDESTLRCSANCPAAQVRCGARCAELTSDVEHCGACGTRCSFANAVALCVAGRCQRGACAAGYGDCDGDPSNGCEASLASAAHCGGCGAACAGATPVCDVALRRCSAGCNASSVRCGPLCVDTATDTAHCGACGNRCAFANANALCSAGRCRIGVCQAGFANCDGDDSNGCEVNIGASLSHCGRCDQRCAPANATAVCSSGSCAYSRCELNFGDCDRTSANGCEVSLTSSAAHCGACGNTCRPFNATPACVGGSCDYTACALGFGDCDSIRANGCETNIQASLSHCGRCAAPCSLPNATAECASGACSIQDCQPPFANCDGVVSNGCEVDTSSSSANCGRCGLRCSAGQSCVSGTCG